MPHSIPTRLRRYRRRFLLAPTLWLVAGLALLGLALPHAHRAVDAELRQEARILSDVAAGSVDAHLQMERDRLRALAENPLLARFTADPGLVAYVGPMFAQRCGSGLITGLKLRGTDGAVLFGGCPSRHADEAAGKRLAAEALRRGKEALSHGPAAADETTVARWLHVALPLAGAAGALELEVDLYALLDDIHHRHAAGLTPDERHLPGLAWLPAGAGGGRGISETRAGFTLLEPLDLTVGDRRLALTMRSHRSNGPTHDLIDLGLALAGLLMLVLYYIAIQRRRAEVRTRLTQGDLRLWNAALAASHNAILIVAEDGSLVHANAAFGRVTGLDPAAADLPPWPAVLHAHACDPAAAAAAVAAAETAPAPLCLRRPDGTLAWVELKLTPFVDDGGRHYRLVVMRDVSALVASEDKYRSLVDEIREVIYQLAPDGRLLFLSRAWERITGFPAEECIGENVFRFAHPEELSWRRRQFEMLVTGHDERLEYEARFRTRTGDYCWMAVSLRAERAPDGKVVRLTGTLADVTGSRAATAAIALRERALQAAAEGVVITDLDQPDNPIIYANAAFQAITGYSARDVLGQNPRFLHGSEHDQPALEVVRRAIAERRGCQVVLRDYRKDGSPYWTRLTISPVPDPLTGRVRHYIGIQSDITAQRQAEEMLRQSLARLDLIFTQSPDAMVCFDGRHRLSYANPAIEAIAGQATEALIGMPLERFEALLHDRRDPALPWPALPAAPASSPAAEGDAPADAELLHLRLPEPRAFKRSLRRSDSDAAALTFYLRDVTREVELDHMKSQFLSTAAHELRSPMASIYGFSELLLTRRFDEARTRDVLDTINRQARRLSTLVADLLDLARIEERRGESFVFAPLEPAALARESAASVAVPGAQHRLTLALPAALPLVRADRAKLQQALINLIDNAFKYSPAGGEVRIDACERIEGGRPWVGIRVQDHGIGMSPEQLAHCCERFYRANGDGSIPGTGLGLALVQEIMKIHGGRVDIDSAPGVGTTAILWLAADGPLAPPRSQPDKEPLDEQPRPA